MFTLKYYCQGSGHCGVVELLNRVRQMREVRFQIADLATDGRYDSDKEKAAYERDFKPRMKELKRATGMPITRLRSRRARNYFVSTPGTVALLKDGKAVWWCLGDEEIARFLSDVLTSGRLPT